MPLPSDASTPWPPAGHTKIAADLDIADAWWSGDPDRLATVYGGISADQAHEQRRPSNRLKDMFWGRQITDPAQERDRIHVPAAADIAATGADLLFGGDDIRLQIPEAHGKKPAVDAVKAEADLTDLTERIGLSSTLLEAAELCGAHGGVFLRPSWDKGASDDPILWVIHADRVIPEFRMGQLVALTAWSEVENTGSVVWRHLERHEYSGQGPDRRPLVLHGLYRGTKDKLGAKSDLSAHPATAGIEADGDGRGVVPDGIRTLMVRYVPNVRPNRRHRHSWVGRPDTQGAEALMSSMDETMSSWMRDLRLGQRRVIVPDQYLERGGRGTGASFDLDREVFSPLAIDPGNVDSTTITLVDFDLRTEDHERTARALFERIVAVAQYSPQSFGLPSGGGEMTATEVNSKDSRSNRTTFRKQRYWGAPAADVSEQLVVIEKEIFGRDVIPMRPRIEWPDLAGTDIRDIASALNLINLARAASIETKVRMLHADWEEPEILKEIEALKAEDAMADPTGGFP